MWWKNELRWSGVVKEISPVMESSYVNKKGETVIKRRRTVLLVNKYHKRNRWFVSEALFEFDDYALDKVAKVYPRLEVIVTFKLDGKAWKWQDKEGFTNRLYAYDIFSPRDTVKKPEWMEIKNFEIVKDPTEPGPAMSLAEEEKLKRRPETRGYTAEDFDPKGDYSEINNNENGKPKKPIPKDAGESDLPF